MGTEAANCRVIAGRYRLEVRLGRGGMGVVWQATDQLLGRRVAVKELPFDDTLSAAEARRQRELTLREARAVAQLSHPHVIVVHDVVEHDERAYMVMELIDGGSLADRIAAGGPLDAVEAARIGIDLLAALRTAHAAGILHRDIKPANVLIESGTGRVVLTDFGIAQVAGTSTLTEAGSFVGSPEYTAPERMTGARTGPQSDLWSVGALLCAALSGESPFRRDSLSGTVHAVMSADIRPPAQAEPILPVVRGLLERDPHRRLDAADAERMLRDFRETGTVPKRFSTAGSDDGERRYSPRGALVTAVLVAAMAGVGVSAAALLVNGGGDGGVVPSSPASSSVTPSSRTQTSVTPSGRTQTSVTPSSVTSTGPTQRSRGSTGPAPETSASTPLSPSGPSPDASSRRAFPSSRTNEPRTNERTRINKPRINGR